MAEWPTEWEKILTNDVSIFKIYKRFIEFNIKTKQNNPIKKLTENLNRHFLKKICRWPKAHEDIHHH